MFKDFPSYEEVQKVRQNLTRVSYEHWVNDDFLTWIGQIKYLDCGIFRSHYFFYEESKERLINNIKIFQYFDNIHSAVIVGVFGN